MQPVVQNNGAKPTRVVPPKRMTLANVSKGRIAKPIRVLLFGVEGIGKTTFASKAPRPIFLGPEDGSSELDVERFPEPHSWPETLDAIDTLTAEPHEYQTLVVDTLDWVEPLCWAQVCTKPDEKGVLHDQIEDFGFAKGYNKAVDEWRIFLSRLERMRAAKGMGVILLAHSWIKPFKNPEADDYDRYELKLHGRSGGLIKEWCDAVLFANYETYASKKGGRTRGQDTGARLIHTQRRAAWDAKNRYDLPETLPLDWDAFAEAVVAHRPASPAHTRSRIEAMLAELNNEQVTTKVHTSVARAGDDAAELVRIADKLSGLLSTTEIAQ
jgi:hypothetical protein